MKTKDETIKKVYYKISNSGIDVNLFPKNEAMMKNEAEFRDKSIIITTEIAPDIRLGYDKANRLYFLSVNDFGERNELVYFPSEKRRNLLDNNLPWWYKSQNNITGRIELFDRVACNTGTLKNEFNLHFSASDKFKSNVYPIAKTGNYVIWNDAALTLTPPNENLNHLPQIINTVYLLITSRNEGVELGNILKAQSIDLKKENTWDDQENFSCIKHKVETGKDCFYLVETTEYATSFRDWNRYNSIFPDENKANKHIKDLGFQISSLNHETEIDKLKIKSNQHSSDMINNKTGFKL